MLMSHSQRNAGLIFLATVFVRLIYLAITGFVADDAFITFRYAENIAAGHGFVYNIGERVLGTSTPLFTFLLSIFAVARINVVNAALLISILSSGLAAAFLYRTAERLRFSTLWAIPVVLYMFWPRSIIAETSGMETAFYTMFIMMAFYYRIAHRPYYALAAATLATVTRPEGALLLGLLLVSILWRYPYRWFSLLAVPAVILVPWLAFAHYYFGSILPHTIPAKLALYSNGLAGTPLERISYILGLEQGYGWPFLLLVPLGLYWIWRTQRTGIVEFLWLIGTIAFYTFSETRVFFWYVAPLAPILLLFSSGAIVLLFDSVESLEAQKHNLVPLGSLLIMLALGFVNFQNSAVYRAEQEQLRNTHEAIGLYIRTHSHEEVEVAAEDIGYIGHYAERKILDRDGLVSPEAVPYNRVGAYGQLIYDYQPDFVVASTASPISTFLDDSTFTAQYEERRSYAFSPTNRYIVFERKSTAAVND